MCKRKNIEYKNISIDSINSILSMANEKQLEVEEFYGCLQDNYIIDADNDIFLGTKRVTRDYIIISENTLNEWSSTHNIIMTDNIKQVEEYRKKFEAYINN